MGVKNLLLAQLHTLLSQKETVSLLLAGGEWTHSSSPQDSWLNRSSYCYRRSGCLCAVTMVKCAMDLMPAISSQPPSEPSLLSLEPKEAWLPGWGCQHPMKCLLSLNSQIHPMSVQRG